MDLVDPFGRTIRDLRISVTDRCNFRCTYCMPAEGLPWLPRDEVLSYEEYARIARICVERWGFDAIRITGGEPTLRADIVALVAMLADLGLQGRRLGIETQSYGLTHFNGRAVDEALSGFCRLDEASDLVNRIRVLGMDRISQTGLPHTLVNLAGS